MLRRHVFALVLAGCGGPEASEVAGLYAVTSQVTSACAADQPVTPSYELLRVTAIAGGVDVAMCYSPEGCAVPTTLTEETGDGWRGAVARAQLVNNNRVCQLFYDVTVLAADDDTITLDSTLYVGAEQPGMCREDVAAMRGTTMPCRTHDRSVAVAIPDAP